MSTLRRSLPILLLQLHILSGGGPAAAKVPALIVFGDSTVDTGNNNYISTVIKSDFAPYGRDLRVDSGSGQPTGRFSNGRLAVDFISEAFGLPPLVPAYLDPNANMSSLVTGACFASAGAGYDNATSDIFSVLPLWKELDYFKEYAAKLRSFQGDDKAQETLSEALYIVSMGTNDFLENYYAVPSGHAAQYAAASDYASYLLGVAESFARALHALGARKLDLNGLPPMGCLPLERHAATGACTEEYNDVARGFNAGLQDLVARLDAGDGGLGGGARVVYGDVYGAVAEVLADPAAHGFEDIGAGCCGTTGRFEMGYMCNAASPLTCADAGKFAFWDAIHPTEHLHRFIADRKMNTTLYVFL
ncbi:GDSL esterase/lipase [Dichanthelium oligosanthes]|uniref:GDSL esterase/lipase n=1 Tax=Dichanthelium oligosanthes TaxID=888268 RepID=A0A1E5VLY5_9POAL|nr:GDSL esterase/lipase [Dichanthelium oligosanthes]